VLTNLWVPDPKYNFPILENNKKRGHKFQHKWFHEFKWLCYSEIKSGAFCKHCVLFAKSGNIDNQSLGNLVIEPFTNYKKAKEVLIFFVICNHLLF
jgi:hypothetical protein